MMGKRETPQSQAKWVALLAAVWCGVGLAVAPGSEKVAWFLVPGGAVLFFAVLYLVIHAAVHPR